MDIRIPSGTRDLIGNDVRKKRWLQSHVMNLFETYGFEEVMTPAFEYYQTYNAAFASLQDCEMYKFFDENNDILTLRMDMTVPIARLAATRFHEARLPLRFCYSSQVYKVKKSFAGKRTEVMDCGVELIGTGDTGDLEVLALAIDVLESLPVGHYTFEIGDVNFFSIAAEKVFDNPEDIAVLASLIDRKSMVELEEFLQKTDLDPIVQNFFLQLPMLAGDASVLKKALMLSFDEDLANVIRGLMAMHKDLEKMGIASRISYDLGKLPHLNYYTGLIFEAYVEGVGMSVLSGGRYDTLLEQFGTSLPARGFSIKLDYLLDVLPEMPKQASCRIYYPEYRFLEAYALARKIRPTKNVEMRIWDNNEIVEENIL